MSKNLKNAVIATLALALATPAFAHERSAFISEKDIGLAPVASQIGANRIGVSTKLANFEITTQCDKGSLLIVERETYHFGSEPNPKVTGIYFDRQTGDVMATASNYGEIKASKDLKLGDICDGPKARDATAVMHALIDRLTCVVK